MPNTGETNGGLSLKANDNTAKNGLGRKCLQSLTIMQAALHDASSLRLFIR